MPGLQIFQYMYILLYVSDSQALGIGYIACTCQNHNNCQSIST